MSRFPISITAPLLVGIPVLIVGLWLSAMWNRQSRDAVTELADQNIAQIHNLAATKVADVLSIPVRICQVNEQLILNKDLDPTDLASWRATLARQSQAFDMLSSIVWGSRDGRSVWVSRYGDGSTYWALKDDADAAQMSEWRLDSSGEIVGDRTNVFDFNLFSRPWYQAPVAAGRAAWSEPYLWVGGVDSDGLTLGISHGRPVHDAEGELLGVVDADFSLNDLSQFLGSIRIGKTGVAALTSRDGQLLAVSNETPIVDEHGELLAATDSQDVRIAAAGQIAGGRDIRDSHTEVRIAGDVHYIRISPIGNEVGLDWSLMTIVPEQDFTAQIDADFRRSWLASLLGVALALGLGLAAARWLVSPLTQLVSAVRRIGAGDLQTRVNLHHAPEYTNLGEEINRMTLGLQDRLRMRQSLSLAMEVQKNLLPDAAPLIEGLDIAGHSTYCDETGGDYYDYLDVSGAGEGVAVIAVGDVMGHGVAAAMLMATARGILRSRTSEPGSLADFLDHLNAMLVRDTRGQRFMTMLLVTVAARQDSLRWASAGHGPPVVYDAGADDFLELDGGGLPLGLMEDEAYDEHVQSGIGAGCIMLAATDGLWETMNPHDEAFGMDRVREIIRRHADRPAKEIRNSILDALIAFRGPAGQDDDLTFVIAKVV